MPACDDDRRPHGGVDRWAGLGFGSGSGPAHAPTDHPQSRPRTCTCSFSTASKKSSRRVETSSARRALGEYIIDQAAGRPGHSRCTKLDPWSSVPRVDLVPCEIHGDFRSVTIQWGAVGSIKTRHRPPERVCSRGVVACPHNGLSSRACMGQYRADDRSEQKKDWLGFGGARLIESIEKRRGSPRAIDLRDPIDPGARARPNESRPSSRFQGQQERTCAEESARASKIWRRRRAAGFDMDTM